MTLASCHSTRAMQARGLCKPCYDKWLKSVNPMYKQRQVSNTTAWAKKNPEKMRVIQMRRKEKDAKDPNYKLHRRGQEIQRKYGITLSDYAQRLELQNGGCAICQRKPGKLPLHIDHNHVTGEVRGLLCHQCNWYLGTIDKDPAILSRIRTYRNEDYEGESAEIINDHAETIQNAEYWDDNGVN